LENSADSTRSAEGGKSENGHADGINDGESQKPRRYAGMPLTPHGYPAIKSKGGEKSADGFMKKLPCSTPPDAPSDLRRIPQCGIEAGGHNAILV